MVTILPGQRQVAVEMVVEFSLTRFEVLLAVFENSQSSPDSVREAPVMVNNNLVLPLETYSPIILIKLLKLGVPELP